VLNALCQKLTDLDTTRPALRSFGLSVGGVFLALAAGVAWMGTHWLGPWSLSLGGIGGGLVVLGALIPVVLRPVYIAWMVLAYALRLVMTPVVLTVIYVVVVVPTGLLLRLSGTDPMRRRPDPDTDSYWREKEPRDDGEERLQTYY
jgi:hypothetical protein